MSTHVPGFQLSFVLFFHNFVMAKLVTSSIRVEQLGINIVELMHYPDYITVKSILIGSACRLDVCSLSNDKCRDLLVIHTELFNTSAHVADNVVTPA